MELKQGGLSKKFVTPNENQIRDVMNEQERRQDEKQPPPEMPTQRVVDSKELFAGQNAVMIRHGNEFYRLILTRNGKLILQK